MTTVLKGRGTLRESLNRGIVSSNFTFGMKIKDMVAVAGNIMHTLSAAYSCLNCSLFKIIAKKAPIMERTTTL